MKTTRVWEQRVEVDVLTTIILNDPLGDSVLLILEIQSSTRGRGNQREQVLHPWDPTTLTLPYELWLLPEHFGLIVSRDHQAVRKIIIFSGLIDPDQL